MAAVAKHVEGTLRIIISFIMMCIIGSDLGHDGLRALFYAAAIKEQPNILQRRDAAGRSSRGSIRDSTSGETSTGTRLGKTIRTGIGTTKGNESGTVGKDADMASRNRGARGAS